MINSKEKRHITIVGKGGGGQAESVNWDDIQNKPDFAEVATSGDYDDLENKPQLATVATSGSYNDLTDKPTILTQWFGTQAEYDAIAVKDPNVIYNIEGSDNVQADWNQSDSSADDYIKNKPTIPAAQVNADWNANSGVAQILNKPTLATVATTGSYNDLSDKPTVTQEQADWNQTDNTQVDFIKNKPTIPTVPAMATETLTFTLQGGTTKTVEFYTVPNYFYVEDASGSDNTLTIKASDYGLPTITVYKSTDQKNWVSMGNISTNGITATVPANSRLYLKANGGTLSRGYASTKITCANNFNVGGYVMSLVNGDNLLSEFSGNGAIKNLFSNSTTLINASNLVLSATTLTVNCYASMFSQCTSLTTAPELPATTLAQGCYYGMFDGCTSLVEAPALPATTLVYTCYTQMFFGCTNINKIVCYANGARDNSYTGNWLGGVSNTGDFYKLGNYNFNTSASGIPSGWTVHTSL